jgi:hypothetical protein
MRHITLSGRLCRISSFFPVLFRRDPFDPGARLVDDPAAVGREIARVLRPGGIVWLTTPANYPTTPRASSTGSASRSCVRSSRLVIREIVLAGRDAGAAVRPLQYCGARGRRTISRQIGMDELALEGPASVVYFLSNLMGRGLELLAESGPLASFLTYLDKRLPMNYLVVAVRPE